MAVLSQHFGVTGCTYSTTRASDYDSYPGAVTALRKEARCPEKGRQESARESNSRGKGTGGGTAGSRGADLGRTDPGDSRAPLSCCGVLTELKLSPGLAGKVSWEPYLWAAVINNQQLLDACCEGCSLSKRLRIWHGKGGKGRAQTATQMFRAGTEPTCPERK